VKIGERVYLRPRQKSDAPIVAALSRQEPDTNWDAGRWIRSTPGYASWVAGDEKEDVPSDVRFAVCLRETDELIGQVGISDIDRIHGYAESDSEIFRDEYRGGGYGSEAKHLLFDYAFNTLGLHSLQSFVIFPNTRSAAALRKQGYRDAGRLSWVFPSFGKFENIACFDLLAADWRAMPRTAALEGSQ
jgi:RimJ/RimL family protein N-acetyltransferase